MNKHFMSARSRMGIVAAVVAALVGAGYGAAAPASRPAGFAVLGDHGPGEWADMEVPAGWTSDRDGDPARIVGVINTMLPPLSDNDRQRGYILWAHHFCDQVVPELTPMPQELAQPVAMAATPGEYEPASFCIRGIRQIKGLLVSVTPLRCGEAEIAPENLDLRIVRYMPRAVDAAKKTYALRPVYLEQREHIDLPANMTAQYWLTVKLPADQPAGAYEGQIEVKAEGLPGASLPLRVEVLPIRLEKPPTIYCMYHPFNRAWKHSYHDLPQTAMVHATDMAEHGMNGVIMYGVPYIEVAGDGVRVDFEKVTTHSGSPISVADEVRCAVKAGLDKQIVWYLGDLDLTVGPLNLGAGTPRFQRAYGQVVGEWEAYRKKNGWPTFAYAPHDEIDSSAERTSEAKAMLPLFKNAGLPVMMTYIGLGERRKETYPLVDMCNFGGDVFRAEFISEVKGSGKKLWSYSGSASYGLDAKGDRYFFGLFGAAIGADGVSQWAYQSPDPAWIKDSEKGPYTPLTSGTGAYYSFPTEKGVLPTIGFEGIREGIDDAKYIFTLRQWIGRAAASGNQQAAGLARKAQQRLDDLMEWVDINRQNIHFVDDYAKYRNELTCHKQPYTMTGADFDGLRQQWVRDIIAIQHSMGAAGR